MNVIESILTVALAAPAAAPAASATAPPAASAPAPASAAAPAHEPAPAPAPAPALAPAATATATPSQPEPRPAPEPPPPRAVVAETDAAPPPSVEDHPVYGSRYRAASGVLWAGVGFIVATPVVLTAVALPAHAIKRDAIASAKEADTLDDQHDALDRAYSADLVKQGAIITAIGFATLGIALAIGGGARRARARRKAERDDERRARVEPVVGGVTVRF